VPDLNISIPHQLPQDEALRRIRTAIDRAKVQYADHVSDLQEHWNDNVGTLNLTVRGMAIPATVTVNPSDVAFQATLPMIASFFMGQIETTAREMLSRVLG
jgi:hypothetical protein